MFVNYDNMNDSWKNFFMDEKIIEEIKNIESKVEKNVYYPEKKNVFRFTSLDLNNIKYVLMGMDPYPKNIAGGGCVANGRAFEPSNFDCWLQKSPNASIRNLLKAIYEHETQTKASLEEIREEIKTGKFKILPPHEFFDNLENQGVLFLNYALTVKHNQPGSHLKLWKNFSEELIKYIDNNYSVDWILLGDDAQSLSPIIRKGNIIRDMHPATVHFADRNKCLSKMKNIEFTKRV